MIDDGAADGEQQQLGTAQYDSPISLGARRKDIDVLHQDFSSRPKWCPEVFVQCSVCMCQAFMLNAHQHTRCVNKLWCHQSMRKLVRTVEDSVDKAYMCRKSHSCHSLSVCMTNNHVCWDLPLLWTLYEKYQTAKERYAAGTTTTGTLEHLCRQANVTLPAHIACGQTHRQNAMIQA